MKKLNVKPLVISALTAVAFGAIGVGTTFALFTDNAETHISIGSGKVNVGLTASDLVLYSAKADTGGSLIDENGAKYVYEEKTAGSFTNGGTASLTGNVLTLNKVTPGDRVTFNVALADQSNVNIKYRLVLNTVKAEGEADKFLAKGLEVTTDLLSGTSAKYTKLEKYVSTWTYHEYNPSDLLSGTYHFDIALPITAGNEYQDKKVEYYISVEAVQGNAVTNDDDAGTFFFLDDAETVVANTATVLEAKNNDNSISVKTTIPADGGLKAGQQVDLVVSSLDVQTGTPSSTLNFDVSLFVDGEKATSFNGKNIAVEVKVGGGLDILHVYHNGTEITSYSYDIDTGIVSFSTTTFSPFSVEYKEHVKNTSYNFYDSYPAGDHWVHEVHSKQDFKQILVHISKYGKYVGTEENKTVGGIHLADEKTVYKLVGVDGIFDFEGSCWDISDNESAEYSLYTNTPFTGVLEGNNNTLKDLTLQYNGSIEKQIGCLFAQVDNAEIRNFTIVNFDLTGTKAKGAGLIAGQVATRALQDTSSYLKFKNITIDSTSSISIGKSSAAAFIGYGRQVNLLSFEQCTNYANVRADGHTAAALAASATFDPSGQPSSVNSSLVCTDCYNYGNITSNTAPGCVAMVAGQGQARSTYTFTNVKNFGKLTSTKTNTISPIINFYSGEGVSDYISGVTLNNVSNFGQIIEKGPIGTDKHSLILSEYTTDKCPVLLNDEEVSYKEFRDGCVSVYDDTYIDLTLTGAQSNHIYNPELDTKVMTIDTESLSGVQVKKIEIETTVVAHKITYAPNTGGAGSTSRSCNTQQIMINGTPGSSYTFPRLTYIGQHFIEGKGEPTVVEGTFHYPFTKFLLDDSTYTKGYHTLSDGSAYYIHDNDSAAVEGFYYLTSDLPSWVTYYVKVYDMEDKEIAGAYTTDLWKGSDSGMLNLREIPSNVTVVD